MLVTFTAVTPLITIGLMGLVASFHGLILAAGRATLEFGRVRYLPEVLGRVHVRRGTPANALLVNINSNRASSFYDLRRAFYTKFI